jgi:hypothetical protein
MKVITGNGDINASGLYCVRLRNGMWVRKSRREDDAELADSWILATFYADLMLAKAYAKTYCMAFRMEAAVFEIIPHAPGNAPLNAASAPSAAANTAHDLTKQRPSSAALDSAASSALSLESSERPAYVIAMTAVYVAIPSLITGSAAITSPALNSSSISIASVPWKSGVSEVIFEQASRSLAYSLLKSAGIFAAGAVAGWLLFFIGA